MNPYLTTDPDICRCPTCGHEWFRDDSPEHSCVPGLMRCIAVLDARKAKAVEKLRAVIIAESASTGPDTRTNHGARITL